MAVRRRALEPDTIIETRGREIAVVSDQAFLEMSVAFAQMQLIGGGVVTSIVERYPTDLPGEMVTTRAIFEWKDRTDAKAQPEAQTGVALAPDAPLPDPSPAELEHHLEEEAAAGELAEPEEAEDDSAIPAGQR
jgi:hypothetical protein